MIWAFAGGAPPSVTLTIDEPLIVTVLLGTILPLATSTTRG